MSREINVAYVPYSLSFRGFSTSVVVRNTQTPYWLLLILSASFSRVSQPILTSKRGHELIGAKCERRLGIRNSGLPKWANRPHGNGVAIVGSRSLPMEIISIRSIHTEVRQSSDSSKPRPQVGPESLEEMLVFDDTGRCNNAFQVITDTEVLMTSYDRIKSNPGNMVQGSDKETLDGITAK